MTENAEPIFHSYDPRRVAKKIKCEVCNICEWQKSKNGNLPVCIYGGPYLGYITPEKLKDEL